MFTSKANSPGWAYCALPLCSLGCVSSCRTFYGGGTSFWAMECDWTTCWVANSGAWEKFKMSNMSQPQYYDILIISWIRQPKYLQLLTTDFTDILKTPSTNMRPLRFKHDLDLWTRSLTWKYVHLPTKYIFLIYTEIGRRTNIHRENRKCRKKMYYYFVTSDYTPQEISWRH